MLASHVPGRIRIRHKSLRKPKDDIDVSEKLMELEGVSAVSVNENIGSLLLCYDHRRVSPEKLLRAVYEALPGLKTEERPRVSASGWTRRQTAKRGMSVSLLLALGMAVLDEEDLHVFFGLGFLGFLALHLHTNQKSIFK